MPKKILFESAVHQLLTAVRRGRPRLAQKFNVPVEMIESTIDDAEFIDLGAKKLKITLRSKPQIEFELDYAGAEFYGRGDLAGKESAPEELVLFAQKNEAFFDQCAVTVFERILKS